MYAMMSFRATKTSLPTAPLVHIRTWQGEQAVITDMTNAGKRGKKCRTFHFAGWRPSVSGSDKASAAYKAFECASEVQRFLADPSAHELTYDAIKGKLYEICGRHIFAGMPENYGRLYEEEIRGIDAPVVVLDAGVDGVWGGKADEKGISLSDYSDPYNLPASITHNQTGPAAYAAAKKVWAKVQKAKTMNEAASILREAGARLHYYCRMD